MSITQASESWTALAVAAHHPVADYEQAAKQMETDSYATGCAVSLVNQTVNLVGDDELPQVTSNYRIDFTTPEYERRNVAQEIVEDLTVETGTHVVITTITYNEIRLADLTTPTK